MRILLLILFLIFSSVSYADDRATRVTASTTNFNNNLSSADNTVQKALDTLDNLSVGASSGDVTAVGDCTSGACFNGTSGASLQFEGSTADTNEITLTSVDPTLDVTVTIPAGTGTLYITGGTDVSLADGGTGRSLVDPNDDQILFWNDTSGQVQFMDLGTNLSLSGNTISASGGSGDVTDVGDCTSGACFTSSTGGTQLFFEGSTSDTNEIQLTSADPTADYTLTFPAITGTILTSASSVMNGQVFFTLDGGGTVPASGNGAWIRVPYNMTVTSWDCTADVTGTIAVDILKSTYAGFPPTVSIAGSEKPSLTNQRTNQDTNLTTWTTSISSGDYLMINVQTSPVASTVTKVGIAIHGTKI